MCGIAGISGWKGKPEDLKRALQSMQKALGHRGPDDHGLLLDPKSQWGLAHTRLSILDLSPCARQPMTSSDGKWHIVFNGEIYNFRGLRPALERTGHRFRSTGDTEVLLELLVREGPDALRRLGGMFSLGLLHAADGRVFLARDLFGIKPLYTAIGTEGELLFASEVRALLASGRIAKKISPAGLDGYLRTGSLPRPHTLVEGVYQMRAGAWSEYIPGQARSGDLLPFSYFSKIDFPATSRAFGEKSLFRQVRSALENSLEAHFTSDVPVGLFLSGGIDSTALAALAWSCGRKGLKSYSLGFREAQHDESTLTRRVARRFGMEHHLLRLDQKEARELFEGYLAALDQPTLDGFNTFCVASLAARDGIKVVLSGLGGDEMFGGYASFSQVPKLFHWRQKTGRWPAIGSWMGICPVSRFRRIGEILAESQNLEQAFSSYRGNFTAQESSRIRLELGAEGPGWDPRADVYEPCGKIDRARFPSDEDLVGYLELSRYMRHQLLKDSDVFSMAHGLELRVPLVDRDLFETLRSVPSARRYQRGKQLLISSVPEIPDYVYQHPKRGFTLPLEIWVRNAWRSDFEGVRKKFSRHLIDPWYRLWSLKTLTHWLEKHNFACGD